MRLARFARLRLLRHALPISLLILRKKPTVLQSNGLVKENHLMVNRICDHDQSPDQILSLQKQKPQELITQYVWNRPAS